MIPSTLFILLLAALFTRPLSLAVDPKPISKIIVMGTVFCDTCSTTNFSKHSYFLQGAKVFVECKFKAKNSASKTEQTAFSANATTDEYGRYKIESSSPNGFECREGQVMDPFCQASLQSSSAYLCNVPGLQNSTEHMAIKAKQANLCIYSLNSLNYRPPKSEIALCGGSPREGQVGSSLDSSEFFLPPIGFPNMPSLPQFGFPKLPFPFHLPPMPMPFPKPPPSLPFPYPPSSPIPRTPSLFSPSPPPPPPLFSLRNPRSWLPFFPPSPTSPHNQHP